MCQANERLKDGTEITRLWIQEPVMEYDRTPSAIRDDLCETDFELTHGYLTVPNGPGPRIEANEKTLRKLSV